MKKLFKIIICSMIFNVLFFNCSFAGPVPDTGQTKCYNNSYTMPCSKEGETFYGQDAQYDLNPQSFTKLDASGNDLPDDAESWVMVRDNVTGLIWEVKTEDSSIHRRGYTCTWQNAQNVFIATLNNEVFGGFSDWRLPSPKELKTIVNSQLYNPTIDQTYFPETVSSYYWASTTFASNSTYAWLVYFQPGYVYYNTKTKAYWVRAVRGVQSSNLAFVDNGDGTVTDPSTGLMWQQGNAGTMTWETALSYCEGLDLAGYSDWRLPNDKELQSIVDYTKHDPSTDNIAFPETVSSDYWSSTTSVATSVNDHSYARSVNFLYGYVFQTYKTRSYYVRAVRGGQSNEFDNLTIFYPNGGEALYRGCEYTVTWKSVNIYEEVSIGLYKGGIDPAHLILQLVMATENNGEFNITLPDDLEHGHDYYIGISTVSGEIQDFSDAPFSTHYPGDINGDQLINLSDALLGLKVVAGISGISDVYIESDVNNDGKIGTDEVVYVLREIAE